MRLSEYLEQKNLTPSQFGELAGLPRSSVEHYSAPLDDPYYRRPGKRATDAIYLATGGAVTPNDFHDLPQLGPRLAESVVGE